MCRLRHMYEHGQLGCDGLQLARHEGVLAVPIGAVVVRPPLPAAAAIVRRWQGSAAAALRVGHCQLQGAVIFCGLPPLLEAQLLTGSQICPGMRLGYGVWHGSTAGELGL